MKRKYKLVKVRVPVSRFPSRNWGQTINHAASVGRSIAQTSAHTVENIRVNYPRAGVYGVRKSVSLPKARRA